MSKKKVLVTGGAGFIGSYVCRELLKMGHEPIVYDAFIQYVSPFESCYQKYLELRFLGIRDQVTFVRGDTRDKNDIRKVIQKHQPSVIIHLANMPIADLSYTHSEEAMGSIIQGTVNVMDAMVELGSVDRLVYASSSMIYGDFERNPCDEDAPKKPKDVYGGTKYATEILISTYGRRYGLKYTIVRPSAVYGPTDANRRVSQIFLENALRGQEISVHGGAGNTLDFTFVEDTAQGIALAAFAPGAENETFNITRGEARSLMDYALILKERFPALVVKEVPMQVYRPKRGTLDISKARKHLGYDPKYTLEAGLAKYIDFFVSSVQTASPIGWESQFTAGLTGSDTPRLVQ